MNTLKPIILIYEGIPGSGKTTLRYEYGKLTNFENLTIDRFTPTQWVFATLRGDDIDYNQSQVERLLEENFTPILIWCQCPIDIAYERCQSKHDEIDSSLVVLERLQKLYAEYFSTICRFTNVVSIDTTWTIDSSCNDIAVYLTNLMEKVGGLYEN